MAPKPPWTPRRKPSKTPQWEQAATYYEARRPPKPPVWADADLSIESLPERLMAWLNASKAYLPNRKFGPLPPNKAQAFSCLDKPPQGVVVPCLSGEACEAFERLVYTRVNGWQLKCPTPPENALLQPSWGRADFKLESIPERLAVWLNDSTLYYASGEARRPYADEAMAYLSNPPDDALIPCPSGAAKGTFELGLVYREMDGRWRFKEAPV